MKKIFIMQRLFMSLQRQIIRETIIPLRFIKAHAIWTIWHWLQLFYIRQQELLHIKPIVQIGSVSLTGRIQLSSRYVGTVCGLLWMRYMQTSGTGWLKILTYLREKLIPRAMLVTIIGDRQDIIQLNSLYVWYMINIIIQILIRHGRKVRWSIFSETINLEIVIW